MKTFSKRCNSWQTHDISTFFHLRRNQQQFSPTHRPSHCLRRSLADHELHIHMHRVPYSFLVCPIPQKSLQFLQEETMKNSKNFGARNLKDKSSPVVKYTVQVSDSAMYYCLLRDTVPRAQGQIDVQKPQGPMWRVQWGWEPQTEEPCSPSQSAGTSLEDREKKNQLWLPLIPGGTAVLWLKMRWGERVSDNVPALNSASSPLSLRLPCRMFRN